MRVFDCNMYENGSQRLINSKKFLGGMDQQQVNGFFDSFHRTSRGDLQSSYYNPFVVKPRKRTTKAQLKVLESTFENINKPDATLRKQLGQQLGMSPREVQVWFQNRRAKVKKLTQKKEDEKYVVRTENSRDSYDYAPSRLFPESHMFTPITPKEYSQPERYPTSPLKRMYNLGENESMKSELPNAENLDSSWIEFHNRQFLNREADQEYDNNFFSQ